jgi:stage III sporulation protein AG
MKMKGLDAYMKKPKKLINILFIVFCVGVLMIMLSKDLLRDTEESEKSANEIELMTSNQSSIQGDDYLGNYASQMEAKLEEEFSKISGAGKVEVVIILKTKGEIVVNKDTPYSKSEISEDDGQGGTRESKDYENSETTVVINSDTGLEEPIILKEYYPEISGILIIAEGGDQVVVKNNLINASKVLLDLPANKIEVMKMN